MHNVLILDDDDNRHLDILRPLKEADSRLHNRNFLLQL
jgi:hypothetical protein